jgi:hypothetical protein
VPASGKIVQTVNIVTVCLAKYQGVFLSFPKLVKFVKLKEMLISEEGFMLPDQYVLKCIKKQG